MEMRYLIYNFFYEKDEQSSNNRRILFGKVERNSEISYLIGFELLEP